VKVPDLNLLIYAVDETAAAHTQTLSWWNAALSGTETVGLAWAVLLGFVRLTTNPRVVQAALTPGDALDYVDRWLARDVTTVVEPTARHTSVLRDLLEPTGTAANLVADAHLAALAIEHGATLCSADRDFGRFPGLAWVNPLDPAPAGPRRPRGL
jgi:toxin-antitoxin system PIN domain toxin